nr:hypothetical protein [Chloroflexota bacterium]
MDLSQQEFYNTVSGETHYGKMRVYINMDHDFEDPDERRARDRDDQGGVSRLDAHPG